MTWKLPTLAECDPGIEPFEYQVLVAMAQKEEKTSGGVILPDATQFRQSWGSDHALLVAVSTAAFSYHDWPAGTTMPAPGDVVFVGQFPGDEITGRDGRKYRLCSDRSIGAVIERAAAQPQELSNAA
jgi:co-chaperonin GroES (HSP10)